MLTGKELLIEGEELRESGKTLEALDKINRSLDAFSFEQNYGGFAHALLARAICWQHLYQFHNLDFGFATLSKKDAEAMLEIVKEKNIVEEVSGAYFWNAKAALIFGEYIKAVEMFETALQKMTPGRNAQKGDWLTNWGKALYFSGRKDVVIQKALEGVEQIKKYSTEVDDYTFKVWLSGGYIRLTEMLAQDNPAESKKYLEQAQQLIAEPKFTVRQKQIEAFLKNGKTGL